MARKLAEAAKVGCPVSQALKGNVELSVDAAPQMLQALSLLPDADASPGASPGWSDETLAWGVRALLRGAPPAQRWPAVVRLIGWMSPAELRDPAWAYWKARAVQASA